MLVLLAVLEYKQLYGMLFGSRGERSFMRRSTAEEHLSFRGTNIAMKKTERSEAMQNVYGAVNYRSAFVSGHRRVL